MTLVRPIGLKKGDAVGVISPSSPVHPDIKYRLQRGINAVKSLGFMVKIGKNATKSYGHSSGTIKERVEDIHQMFEDRNVKAIICSIGGYTSNSLLDYLDYDLIKKNPKIFVGYSDITALHLGIHSRTNLVTFYGPMVMPQFGEFPVPYPFTVTNLMNIISYYSVITLPTSPYFTYEFFPWEKVRNRKRKLYKNPGCRVLKEGNVQGKLIGGHLGTVETLISTKYFPNFKDSIFFWEETESSTMLTERMLTHLRQIGLFDEIKGMLVGRINPNEYEVDAAGFDIYKILGEMTKDHDFPILTDMDFGHTDPMFTLPIGINARLDTNSKTVTLLEPSTKIASI